MSLGMTIVMLVAGWMAVACAMLWGVMRISRRRHSPHSDVHVVKHREMTRRETRAHGHAAAH